MRPRRRAVPPNLPGITETAVLLLILLASLSACSRVEDRSLLTGVPCAAPCWQNLTPGFSTEEDVRRELSASSYVQRDTLQYAPARDDGSAAYFAWRGRGKREIRQYYNRVYVDDGRVSRIEVFPGSDLTLAQITAEFGPPEYVHAAFNRGGLLGFTVVLDYPAKGISFTSTSSLDSWADVLVEEGVIRIPEETRLLRADYYAPASLERVLAYAFGYPPDVVTDLLDETQPWSGWERVKLGSWPRR